MQNRLIITDANKETKPFNFSLLTRYELAGPAPLLIQPKGLAPREAREE